MNALGNAEIAFYPLVHGQIEFYRRWAVAGMKLEADHECVFGERAAPLPGEGVEDSTDGWKFAVIAERFIPSCDPIRADRAGAEIGLDPARTAAGEDVNGEAARPGVPGYLSRQGTEPLQSHVQVKRLQHPADPAPALDRSIAVEVEIGLEDHVARVRADAEPDRAQPMIRPFLVFGQHMRKHALAQPVRPGEAEQAASVSKPFQRKLKALGAWGARPSPLAKKADVPFPVFQFQAPLEGQAVPIDVGKPLERRHRRTVEGAPAQNRQQSRQFPAPRWGKARPLGHSRQLGADNVGQAAIRRRWRGANVRSPLRESSWKSSRRRRSGHWHRWCRWLRALRCFRAAFLLPGCPRRHPHRRCRLGLPGRLRRWC